MCDVYVAKCSVEGCNKKLEMHIGDYSCPREKVKIYCEKHLKQMPRKSRWYICKLRKKWGIKVIGIGYNICSNTTWNEKILEGKEI
jgi:hypothetical protein